MTLAASILAINSGAAPSAIYAEDNHNPLGVVNGCTLNGRVTTVYGWVHDIDAVADDEPTVTVRLGSVSQTVNSSIIGYHDTEINRYLDKIGVSQHSHSYGFLAQFDNLRSGTIYLVRASGINIKGGDANGELRVDSAAASVDGITVGQPLAAGGYLPKECLVNGSKTAAQVNATPQAQNRSTATVVAGTRSARVTVPVEAANQLYVAYGTSPDQLQYSSLEVKPKSKAMTTVVTLPDLQAKRSYYYQIVRSDSKGKQTVGPVARFATSGYIVQLHFQDSADKPVSGIPAVLNDTANTRVESGKTGDVTFADLDAGNYSVTYAYHDRTYSEQFDTSLPTTNDFETGQTTLLRRIVDVASLKNGSTVTLLSTSGKASSGLPSGLLYAGLFVILLIGAGLIWLVMLTLKNRPGRAAAYAPPSSHNPGGHGVIDLPTEHARKLPIKPPKIKAEAALAPANSLPLEHVGESLREMVVRSMHEETQKRKGPGHDS